MNFRKNVEHNRSWITNTAFFSDSNLPGEEWREFKEYSNHMLNHSYMISNKGRIRNSKGDLIRGSISFDGYHEVMVDNVPVRVHRAVLLIFQGGPPEDMESPTVQHINHDKLDNRIENLCWMSAFDNNQEGHGVRCKIVDKYGEHIFPSQKFASKYIGRHDDYISEGIGCNYKMTTAQGDAFEVYTEVEGRWVKYQRRMPNNRRWCRLIKADRTIDFDSYWQCDKFLGKPSGYTQSVIANSWPLLDDQDYKFYTYDKEVCDYVEYKPTRLRTKRFARRCRIIDSSGEEHLFSSISAAGRYLGRSGEALSSQVKRGATIKDRSGDTVEVHILD